MGNLLSPVSNLFFLYGAASYLCSLETATPWRLAAQVPHWISRICYCTLSLSLLQAGVRAHSTASIYGWRFASAVPLRMVLGNLVNSAATVLALNQFSAARMRGKSLKWRKTEHFYPAPQLGDVMPEGLQLQENMQFEDIGDISSTFQ